MRPRIVHTKKILVVAVAVTTAACADRRPPAPTPEPPSIETTSPPAPAPIEAAQPAPIEAAQPAPIEAATRAARVAPARPSANRLSSNDLLALRDKLIDTPREEALTHAVRFRPLCDADGYPLVGNLVRKGPSYTPSAFCRDLRDRGAR